MRTLVYPVPLKAHYTLGVHLTLNPYGGVKIGPSAVPAFWNC